MSAEKHPEHLGRDIREVIGGVAIKRSKACSSVAEGRFRFLSNILLIAADLADDIEGSVSGPRIAETEFANTLFQDLVEREFPGAAEPHEE